MADHMGISIEDEKVQAGLARLTLRLHDLRPLWPMIVPMFIGWMRQQFESEGAFGGEPWAPLSDLYAEQKARVHPGKGILIAEGDLRKAASKPHRIATAQTLELSVDWAGEKGKPVDLEWHQKGTARMPARPLLFGEPLPAEASVELALVVERYVTESIRASGLSGVRL